MANKVLTYTIEVDGKEVEKELNTIENYEERLVQLQDKLNKTPIDSSKYKKLQKELKNTQGQFEKTKMKTQGFTDSLAEAPGVMGQVGQGIKGVSSAFKALLANPIVLVIAAVVAAFTALVKAFTSTKAGGEKVEQVMAGISAAVDVVRDRVLKVGEALVKFFSGDFKGALDSAKEAVSGLGDEIQKEFQIAMDLKRQLQAIDDAQRNLNMSRAEQNRLLQETKEKLVDESLSLEERLKLLDEIRVKEIATAEEEAKLAQQRYDVIKQQNALSDSSKEDLDKEAAAFIELQNKLSETAGKKAELAGQEKGLRDRARAEEEKRQQERETAELAYNDLLQKLNLEQIQDAETRDMMILDNEYKAQQDSINQLKISEEKKNQLLLELDESYEIKKGEIKKTYRDQEKAEELDERTRSLDAELQLLMMEEELKLDIIEEALTRKKELLLENDKLTAEERNLIEAEYQAQLNEIRGQAVLEEQLLEEQRVAVKQKALDDIISIFGAETAAGKAALVAKQLINAQELIAEIRKTITFSTQAAARSTVAVAEGTAQTAKIGFPQNIPMLIGYAAQAVGIVAAIRSAVSSAKGGTSDSGGSGGKSTSKFNSGGLVSGPGTSTSDSIPAMLSDGESVINANSTKMFLPLLSAMNEAGGGKKFKSGGIVGGMVNRVVANQMPIRAYVVESDIRSALEFERKVSTRSAL